MSEDCEAWERDRAWILKEIPAISEDKIEWFCEKTAVIFQENGGNEDKARDCAKYLMGMDG